MAKAKDKAETAAYTLIRGRKQPFRRTVSRGGERVQLVFEPDVDIELSPDDVAQCQDIIDRGYIVLADRDAKGRLRGPNREVVKSLEQKVAEQEKRIAELESLLEKATGGGNDAAE